MANHASHAALPYPIKNARYTVQVPYLDADGDPTDPTTPDTEVSKDGGTFADCAEEVTTIAGTNGSGYITLSGAETDCSMLMLAAKVASGPKATLMTIVPRILPIVGSGTLSAGSAGGGTLGTILAYDVAGCFIRTTGGTGGGGTGGANNQVRKLITYNTGSGAFTVAPNWETTPSADTTYDVLLPEGLTLGALRALNPTTAGRTLDVHADGDAEANVTKWLGTAAATPTVAGVPEVDVTHWIGTAAATPTIAGVPEVDVTHWRGTATPAEHTAGYPIVTVKDGTGTGEIDTSSGKVLLADGAHGGTAATLTLERIIIAATTTNEPGVKVTGNGSGDGARFISGGSGGSGVKIEGQAIGLFAAGVGTNATGMIVAGNGTGDGLTALRGASGQDIDADITGDVTGNLSGSVGSVAAGGIVAGSFAAGAINAAAIADNAIDAASIAADAITAAKIANGAIDAATFAAGAIDAAALADSAADKIIQSVSGTADSGTTTTLVDAARTEADTDYWKGATLLMTSGNLAGERRRITAFNPSTDTITVDSAFTQAVATQNYIILRTGYNEAAAGGSGDWTSGEKEQIRDALGIDGTKTAATGGDVQDIQGRLPAALVSGRMSSDAVAVSGSTAAADAVEANIANLDAAVTTRATAAQVRTEANGAIVDNHLDHLLATDTPAPLPGAAGSVLADMLRDDGGTWSYNANALELAPSGGGGGSQVILGAIQTTVRPGNRLSAPISLEMFVDEAKTFALTVLDANGAPVSLLGKTLRFVVFDTNTPPVGKFKCETSGDGITISGTSNEIALVAVAAAKASFISRDLQWVLRDSGPDSVLLWGSFAIAAERKVVP